MADDELIKNAPEILPIPSEEDSPRIESLLSAARLEELKTKREEDRKDAESQHERLRDTGITFAGLLLLLIFVFLYFFTVKCLDQNDDVKGFLYLLQSVIMLIIGYIWQKNK